ncbi:MAG: phenazine biosynthesis protein PhzF family [Nocardioidaceae bacterium]|nr:phenazine biosynthesis protein PhzF family [Nocardioidaceae bacterium]
MAVPVVDAPACEYDVVDVFADAPFAGNQLAVVHGAEGLADGQLLALAREFGYSETTFPTPTGPAAYDVRIFTPSGEIPFAGHPTLGTAWVLRHRGDVSGAELVQTCAAGEIDVRFGGDAVQLSAAPRDLSGPVRSEDLGPVLADLGLTRGALAGEAWLAGAGLTFLHLPVTEEAVVAAHPGRTPMAELLTAPDLADLFEGINLVAVLPGDVTGDPVRVHARVFVPGLSADEDPATGSAAVGLGMALAASGLLPDGGSYEIRQGLEMGRPSRLHGRVEASAGVPTRVHVAGRVFAVASGTIAVPRG